VKCHNIEGKDDVVSEIDENPKKKYSLFALISDLPGLLMDLISAEIAHAKIELARKFKTIGIGIGLLVGAAVTGFWLIAVLIATAILGLSEAFPPWLSALIIAGVLVAIISVLVVFGVRRLKKGVPPMPEETIENVKEDVRVIKGVDE
jgi:TRAP-type C4-dicarboxylate transport system permease small subunit